MNAIAEEEKMIETAEAQEIVDSYFETEKEIVEEMEIKSLLKEESNLLLLMDKEAEVEAEIEVDKRYRLDILIIDIEKIIARLKKAKDEERADFLKNMDKAARNERAIEVAEEQETISYLEKEKEFLDETESKALQKEEAILLSLMDKEAKEEAEIEIDRWLCPDIHIVEFEERTALLNKAKEKEKTDFLKKMEGVAKDEWAIDVAEAQETESYLETVKEFLVECETIALQKEEAALLGIMDQEAIEEAGMELDSEVLKDLESYLAEERAAFLKKMNEDAGYEKDLEEYLEKRKLWGLKEGFAVRDGIQKN